jgi:predicted dehydrogenase
MAGIHFALHRARHWRNDAQTETTTPLDDQFAPELVHFSQCILEDRDPEPAGEEGLADVRILEAILVSRDRATNHAGYARAEVGVGPRSRVSNG